MNELEISNHSIMSTEVAEMVGKEHKYLMRDIKRYSNQMQSAKISPCSFWEEFTYKNENNQSYPCYLITKKGCEFIAHKMTGAKGTEFTARYINRFHEMEEHIKQQSSLPELKQNEPPKYLTTTTKCPLANPFYSKHNEQIANICLATGITKKQFYYQILRYLSNKYDLKEAERIYKKELGHKPKYSADIIGYFPDLMKDAEAYLDEAIFGKRHS